MLTLANMLDAAEAAAGGVLDPRVDSLDIVNTAGRYLVGLHPWAFLERPPAVIDFVANQNYALLPSDFGQLLNLQVPNAMQTSVNLATMDQVLFYRANTWSSPFQEFVALEYPTQATASTAPANARLAIYPTPGTSRTGALVLAYRAHWTELSAQTDVANIPSMYDSLLIQLVRAFALGYADERKGSGSVATRLEAVEKSAMLARLKQNDGLDTPSLGRMGGGMLSGSDSVIFRPFQRITFN